MRAPITQRQLDYLRYIGIPPAELPNPLISLPSPRPVSWRILRWTCRIIFCIVRAVFRLMWRLARGLFRSLLHLLILCALSFPSHGQNLSPTNAAVETFSSPGIPSCSNGPTVATEPTREQQPAIVLSDPLLFAEISDLQTNLQLLRESCTTGFMSQDKILENVVRQSGILEQQTLELHQRINRLGQFVAHSHSRAQQDIHVLTSAVGSIQHAIPVATCFIAGFILLLHVMRGGNLRRMSTPPFPAVRSGVLTAPPVPLPTGAAAPSFRPAASRYQFHEIPDSKTVMLSIVDDAQADNSLRVKPSMPHPTRVATATHKGNIRPDNQDFALCFEIDAWQIMLIADGCGATPHGARAAYLATLVAAKVILSTLGRARLLSRPRPIAMLRNAVTTASVCLAHEADKLNLSPSANALRTTFIAVVADASHYFYTYLGDGGGVILRSTGEEERFLIPQRGLRPNEITGSLGPTVAGQCSDGVLLRMSGDLLLCGTDGVFDFVDQHFLKDVARAVTSARGDLQDTVDRVLQQLAEAHDDRGFICADNLTLGILSNGLIDDSSSPQPLPAANHLQHGPLPGERSSAIAEEEQS